MKRLSAPPPAAQSAAVGITTSIIVTATRTLPATTGRPVGRKVVIAPSAKIQALGLIAWPKKLRALLDARLFEPLTMAAASAQLGASPTQLARAFSSAFGIAPDAYLLGRRLDAARGRILGGQSLADVAADVGFYDQAHLTRRFKRFLGTTPGRFAAKRVRQSA